MPDIRDRFRDWKRIRFIVHNISSQQDSADIAADSGSDRRNFHRILRDGHDAR